MWILKYLFLGYVKSENESVSIHTKVSENSCYAYSVPTIDLHNPSNQGYNCTVAYDQSPDSNTHCQTQFTYDAFPNINTKDSPWILLPSSVRLRISIQESPEVLGYLDLFSSSQLSLLEDKAYIQYLKKIIPDFLSNWLLYVRMF